MANFFTSKGECMMPYGVDVLERTVAAYETGGYYRCAECGNSIYSPDELELGYWDGYME